MLHHGVLSQLMSRKLTSETAANALLADLVEGTRSASLSLSLSLSLSFLRAHSLALRLPSVADGNGGRW